MVNMQQTFGSGNHMRGVVLRYYLCPLAVSSVFAVTVVSVRMHVFAVFAVFVVWVSLYSDRMNRCYAGC